MEAIMEISIQEITNHKIPCMIIDSMEDIENIRIKESAMITKEELDYLLQEEIIPTNSYPEPIITLLRELKSLPKNNYYMRGKIMCLLYKLTQ